MAIDQAHRMANNDWKNVLFSKQTQYDDDMVAFAFSSKHPLMTQELKKEMVDQLLLTPIPEKFHYHSSKKLFVIRL